MAGPAAGPTRSRMTRIAKGSFDHRSASESNVGGTVRPSALAHCGTQVGARFSPENALFVMKCDQEVTVGTGLRWYGELTNP
jgi:hypothetical protein